MGRKKIDRTGETKINTQGSLMKIIEYRGARDILVEFENGYKNRSTYLRFTSGMIKNNFYPSVSNIGYIGDTTVCTHEGKIKRAYDVWQHMIKRCYNDHSKRYCRYGGRGVKVCEEWHNFQNFEKWYNENYYEIKGEIIELDKDILIKNNKIYSQNTCLFVPQKINTIFIKSNSTRGDLPIGVSYISHTTKKYVANCSIHNVLKHLGFYDTPEEAFRAYKTAKESYIKQVADEYKDKIPQKLYEALYNYEVEITD